MSKKTKKKVRAPRPGAREESPNTVSRTKLRADSLGLTVAQLRKAFAHPLIAEAPPARARKADLVAALGGRLTPEVAAFARGDVGPPPPQDSEADALRPQPRALPQFGERREGNVGGIDVHKSLLAVCVVGPGGRVHQSSHQNDPRGWGKIEAEFRALGVQTCAVEATAEYHLGLQWHLEGAGVAVLVANPLQVGATQGKKTDEFDAERLALAHRDGRLRPSVTCTPDEHAFRKVMRDGARYVQQATECKQRLHQTLARVGAGGTTALLGSVAGRRVLLDAAMGDYDAALQRATGLRRLAEPARAAVTAIRDAGVGERGVLACQLNELVMNLGLAAQAEGVVGDRYLRDAHFQADLDLLTTIPGVGPLTAARILAEIVDVRFFPTPKGLVRWGGLAPRVNQSGHRKRVTGSLYKGGNKYLRTAAFQSVQNMFALAGRTGCHLGLECRAKRDRGLSYKASIVAGARKLVMLVWHLLTLREPYKAPEAPAPPPPPKRKGAAVRGFVRRARQAQELIRATSDAFEALRHRSLESIVTASRRSSGRPVPQINAVYGNACQFLFELDDYLANGMGLTDDLEGS
jgi:transposase